MPSGISESHSRRFSTDWSGNCSVPSMAFGPLRMRCSASASCGSAWRTLTSTIRASPNELVPSSILFYLSTHGLQESAEESTMMDRERPSASYGIRLYTSEHERETKFGGIGVPAVGGSLP